jgi:hypothetical protein
MKLSISIILSLAAVSSAHAQIDAFSLRSKYGLPLDRETFTVRPGINIRVDYGPAKQACTIVLPSGMTVREPSPDIITREQMKDVLDEVVPNSVRGKEIKRGVIGSGILKVVYTEYEHVTVDERFKSGIGTGIVVTSKDPACRKDSTP